MTTEQQVTMHQQHREAQTELDSWLDDIYMWRAEHKQALAWLAQVQAAIHASDGELQQHSSIVDRQERHIRQHEHEIAVQEQQGKLQDETELAEQHENFNDVQAQARETHSRIGEHHRKRMASLKRILDQFTGETA